MLGKRINISIITLLTLLSTLSLGAVETQYSASIMQGQAYLFGCSTYTADATPSETLPAYGGGDSTVHLLLHVTPAVTPAVKVAYTANITEGETYLFGCQQLTAAATYTDTLSAYNGADSIVYMTLNVTPAVTPAVKVGYSAAINQGETYLFGCQQLTAAATYTDTLSAYNGADSIVYLTLTVNEPAETVVKVQYSAQLDIADSYLFGCKTYHFTETGIHTLYDTVPLAGNVDSITIVNLTVYAGGSGVPVNVAYSATIREGETYLFGCQQLTAAATYTDTLTAYNGADSIVHLTLNVTPVVTPTVKVGYTATINQGETYLFGCQQLTAAATYTDTLSAYNGGDSIVYLTLQVQSMTTYGDTTATECDSLFWHGQWCTETKDYVDTLPGANIYGGDSIVTLHMTVLHPVAATIAEEYEGCDSVVVYGKKYTVSGLYADTLKGQAYNGCDSLITLDINVKKPAIVSDAIFGCDSVVYKGITYTADATLKDTIIGGAANGCDSIVTIAIMIDHHATGSDAITACDSIIYKGIKYTADATVYDTIIGGAANGCDSIVTMSLKVLHPVAATIAEEYEGCDSVVVYGKKYTVSGLFADTLKGQAYNGCDSLITLDISVKKPTVATEAERYEDCGFVTVYGKKYTESGLYADTLVNAAGCDSLITLDITVNKIAYAPVETYDECNYFEWHGTRYAEEGKHTYYDTLVTVKGCDSICELNLTITMPYETKLDIVPRYGDRLLMINREQINSIPGWNLDMYKDTSLVRWFREAEPEDEFLGVGYYYTFSGMNIQPGVYYAVIDIPATEGAKCGAKGETQHYLVQIKAQAPVLVPTLAMPGEAIQVLNLDPEQRTTIRIYSTDGTLHGTYSTQGETFFTIQAEAGQGFYFVELTDEKMQSTLRYIVK